MQFHQSVLLLVAPLVVAADRLGSTSSNFESVGEGRTFDAPLQPPVDRSRILEEISKNGSDWDMDHDSTLTSENGVNLFDQEVELDSVEEETKGRPITRKLRRIGAANVAKKESYRDTSIPLVRYFFAPTVASR